MDALLVSVLVLIALPLLVLIGCGGSSAKQAPAAPRPGEPSPAAPREDAVALPLPEDAAPAPAPATAALRAAATVYVERHGTHRFDGLEVYVASIEEKRTTEGDELLKVELILRAGDQVQSAFFAGESERPAAFAGYLVQFRGGSRQAVGLAVVRADAR